MAHNLDVGRLWEHVDNAAGDESIPGSDQQSCIASQRPWVAADQGHIASTGRGDDLGSVAAEPGPCGVGHDEVNGLGPPSLDLRFHDLDGAAEPPEIDPGIRDRRGTLLHITARPGTTARDVLELMDMIVKRVFEESGLELEREVVVWGRNP